MAILHSFAVTGPAASAPPKTWPASERITMPAIMQAGGWLSSQMVARYTKRQAARQGGAAKLAELQNRT